MNCPLCPDATLQTSERQGVEIDHCPRCRGVWLDRGELDKLIERGASWSPPPRRTEPRDWDDDESERRSSREADRSGQRQSRRRGFLGELFDFD